MSNHPQCRFDGEPLNDVFVDLGLSPLSNSYLKESELHKPEPKYPLKTFICPKCFLVQLEEFESPQNIFSDYAYFSSFSESWLKHAKEYTDKIVKRFAFNNSHFVIEIASNDGYLLKNFVEREIPCLGIEPAENVAEVAEKNGVPSIVKFFGVKTATELKNNNQLADLIIGNNVLAHVPDINDFVNGLAIALKENGVITMEFPHLLQLIKNNQFDTIYHEHFSYLSLLAVEKIFSKHNLKIFDVEELSTHGGSLRIYATHIKNSNVSEYSGLFKARNDEVVAKLNDLDTYKIFPEKVEKIRTDLLSFFQTVKNKGKQIVGYGAPAKGNTLLNFLNVKSDLLSYTVDRSPHKQNHYLPGTRIPIFDPEKIFETKPDYILILPWNLKDEIIEQMSAIRNWGGKFVVAIPELEIF